MCAIRTHVDVTLEKAIEGSKAFQGAGHIIIECIDEEEKQGNKCRFGVSSIKIYK